MARTGSPAARAKRGQVSRNDNLAEKYQKINEPTTVMIRNVPTEYSQEELLHEVLDTMDNSDPFDFFYLPWDLQNNTNVGYAFVNFHTPALAQHAVKIFSSYKFRLHQTRKVAKAFSAHVQGLENNLRHLQDRAVVNRNHPHSPLVIWRGSRIDLALVFQELKAADALRRSGANSQALNRADALRRFSAPASGLGNHSAPASSNHQGMGRTDSSDDGSGRMLTPHSFAQVLNRAAGLYQEGAFIDEMQDNMTHVLPRMYAPPPGDDGQRGDYFEADDELLGVGHLATTRALHLQRLSAPKSAPVAGDRQILSLLGAPKGYRQSALSSGSAQSHFSHNEFEREVPAPSLSSNSSMGALGLPGPSSLAVNAEDYNSRTTISHLPLVGSQRGHATFEIQKLHDESMNDRQCRGDSIAEPELRQNMNVFSMKLEHGAFLEISVLNVYDDVVNKFLSKFGMPQSPSWRPPVS